MFCQKCGSEMPDQSSFCPTCGAAAQGVAAPSFGANDYSATSSAANVPDFLVWNILATIFCCLPLGIVGIVYSTKVNGAKARGDYQTAEAASSTAKTWLIVNVVLGALAIFAYLGLAVLGAVIQESGSL